MNRLKETGREGELDFPEPGLAQGPGSPNFSEENDYMNYRQIDR